MNLTESIENVKENQLDGAVLNPKDLNALETMSMFKLMGKYYANINQKQFEKDLSEKDYIIVLKNMHAEICGFSTLMVMDFIVQGQPVKGVFSGDTVIDKKYWGELTLPSTWLKFTLELTKNLPEYKWYWFLITKGYKTYRYLPMYFKTFAPRYDESLTDFEKGLIDAFGKTRYPDNYHEDDGLLHMNGEKDFVKKGIADISDDKLNDLNIKYFIERNPKFYEGNELVCVARLSHDNMNNAAHKYLLGE